MGGQKPKGQGSAGDFSSFQMFNKGVSVCFLVWFGFFFLFGCFFLLEFVLFWFLVVWFGVFWGGLVGFILFGWWFFFFLLT